MADKNHGFVIGFMTAFFLCAVMLAAYYRPQIEVRIVTQPDPACESAKARVNFDGQHPELKNALGEK